MVVVNLQDFMELGEEVAGEGSRGPCTLVELQSVLLLVVLLVVLVVVVVVVQP